MKSDPLTSDFQRSVETMSDVKQSAERLRRKINGESVESIYGCDMTWVQEIEDDKTLAEAYLAEHLHDDDEPITESFLRELGFLSDRFDCRGLNLCVGHNCLSWLWARMHVNNYGLFDITTRGQVRLLVKALKGAQ